MKINSILFDNAITVWWEKPKDYVGVSYLIFLDGKKMGETTKTHYTFRYLMPGTKYTVEIKLAKDGQVLQRDILSYITLRKKKRLDVTAAPYFAVGDGKTLNTKAIQKAIDDCTADCCVYFPTGVFLTGALKLHSDMEFFVDRTATVQGTSNFEDYLPKQHSRFEGVEGECYQSLLNLGDLDCNGDCTSGNVIIRGGGKIFGGGLDLLKGIMEAEGAEYRRSGPYDELSQIAWRTRGRLIEVRNSENVIISDLTLGMSPAWNLHFIYSQNIITFGCKVLSHGVNNGDGWDPDSSEDCIIFGTTFDTGDDSIAIKSGKNPEGNIIDRPSRNIYIFDCACPGGHALAIGSEISGGIENVFVWDCDVSNCTYGLQVKGTKKRGGYVKNIHITDCNVSCLLIWSVGYNDDGVGAPHPPVFSDYYFDGLTICGSDVDGKRRYICLRGFDEEGYEVNNVTLKNVNVIDVERSKALQTEYAKNIIWIDE